MQTDGVVPITDFTVEESITKNKINLISRRHRNRTLSYRKLNPSSSKELSLSSAAIYCTCRTQSSLCCFKISTASLWQACLKSLSFTDKIASPMYNCPESEAGPFGSSSDISMGTPCSLPP